MNICLPNGNGYGEINLKIDDMALQTTFPHLFNLPPILKPCTTKEKYLAILFNAEQVMATLETTTNPQFLQKAYPALVEKKYKHIYARYPCNKIRYSYPKQIPQEIRCIHQEWDRSTQMEATYYGRLPSC